MYTYTKMIKLYIYIYIINSTHIIFRYLQTFLATATLSTNRKKLKFINNIQVKYFCNFAFNLINIFFKKGVAHSGPCGAQTGNLGGTAPCSDQLS